MNNQHKIKIENNQLLEIIKNKIDSKTPLSVVRKGDGENVIIGYNVVHGIKTITWETMKVKPTSSDQSVGRRL